MDGTLLHCIEKDIREVFKCEDMKPMGATRLWWKCIKQAVMLNQEGIDINARDNDDCGGTSTTALCSIKAASCSGVLSSHAFTSPI